MLTQAELKSKLHYNPETGIFTWLETSSLKMRHGDVAGHKNEKGYIVITINGKIYRAHRLAWIYMNETLSCCIDHINTIKDDNRISNLRLATLNQNSFNKKLSKNNTSGVKGVSWNKLTKKWTARIKINNKQITVGAFSDIELAKKVIMEARIKYHGDYANHG